MKKVQGLKISPHARLFTMDVESLYMKIESERRLEAVRRCSSNLQVKGMAMGKRFAPAYANIYMVEWEESVRYLDDVWGVWEGMEGDWLECVHTLNKHQPSIQVKYELKPDRIDFLDTTVYKGPGVLDTSRLDVKVFFKPTDTHALLHRGSHHDTHVFKGIVKAQLLRFRRICNRESNWVASVKTLMETLRRRGYFRQFLRMAAKEERRMGEGRTQALHKKVLPLIVKFSGMAKGLAVGVKRNFLKVLPGQGTGDAI